MNRYLTGYTLLLLSPMAMAFNLVGYTLQDSKFSVNIGNRAVTIGDRTGSRTNLLGEEKSATPVGTTIALVHSTPIAIVEASTLFVFGEEDHALKFSIETQISRSAKHKLYDGVSKTAKVTMHSLPSLDTGEPDGLGAVVFYGDEVQGRFGVNDTMTGGKREATVEHKTSIGGKILYAFGSEDKHNLGIGFGLLWTNDEYRYTVDENPVAVDGSGVIEATEVTTSTPSFPSGFQSEYCGSTAWDSQDITTDIYTPVLGSVATYDRFLLWYGIAAEGTSPINDNISVKAGLSYYKREFEVSKNSATAAPLIAAPTDATMYIGHIGASYKRDAL